MRFDISGHQVEVTPALREYAAGKLDKLGRHFERHLDAKVILSLEKHQHKAEATLATVGKTLFADASAHDMYAAIDALSDKLDRLVIKEKERMKDHHRGVAPARSEQFG